MGLDDKLTFGKYKGCTIKEVIDNDPEYLGWALDKIDWFELDQEAEWALDEAIYEGLEFD